MYRARSLGVADACLVALLTTALAAAPAAAQQLTLGSAGAGQGQTVYIPLTLDDGDASADEVVALQVDVGFDPSRLSAGLASPGVGVADHVVSSSVPSAGVHRLVVYSPTRATLADGQVATIALTVAPGAAPGIAPITLSSVVLATAGAYKLEPVTTVPGAVDVGGGSGDSADLTVTKLVNSTVAVPGEPLTYTVTVTNAGPTNVVGGWFTDDVPAELLGIDWLCSASPGSSCAASGSGDITDQVDIEVGDTLTYTVSGTLASVLTQHVVNTAWISAPSPMVDPNGSNNQDDATSLADFVAPQVTWVGSVADTGDGTVANDEQTTASFSQLMVQFNETVLNPTGHTDPHDVTNPANFRLFEAGSDAIVQTTVCGPAQADDVAIAIPFASHWAPTRKSFIYLNGSQALPEGHYRFMVCGSTSIKDLNSNSLDGNFDGIGGDDFVRDFVVTETNLLLNPNLDDDLQLSDWTATSPDPGEITHAQIDADGYGTSGSVEVQNFTGPAEVFSVSQCVPIGMASAFRVGGLVNIDGGVGGDPSVYAHVQVFATADCSGGAISSASTTSILGDTGGYWEQLDDNVVVPAGVQSARVFFVTDAGSATSFSVLLDNLFFNGLAIIFEDGFESGATDAWSAATEAVGR